MSEQIILNPEKNWKTKREIAAHFKCSVRTITSLMRRRILPFIKQGRFVRFDTDDCDRAMEKLRSSSIFDRAQSGVR
jgi:excisionase family DNA binding protein